MTITLTQEQRSAQDEEELYPSSDGEPMAESDLHWQVTEHCINAVKAHFAERNAAHDNVYVAGDNFLYFLRGNPRSVVSPDCYVIVGVDSRARDSYKTWENDDRLPVCVIEITSKSTRKEDTGRKLWLYQEALTVPEYFLFDPTADYISTRLTGYRLSADGYVPMTPEADGRLYSETLGLWLIPEGEFLRFYDPVRGIRYPTYTEAREQAQRADAERFRADEETQRAEQQAREQTQRADVAEAELAQARARLDELQRQIEEATSLQRSVDAQKDN